MVIKLMVQNAPSSGKVLTNQMFTHTHILASCTEVHYKMEWKSCFKLGRVISVAASLSNTMSTSKSIAGPL